MIRAERKPRTAQAAGEGTVRDRVRRDATLRLLAALVVTVGITAVIYSSVLGTRALCFDDPEYVGKNRLVQQPGWGTVGRFFGEVLEPSSVGGYYQPLAMTSLMLDYALGGRPNNIYVFQRTSYVLHLANTALVVVLVYLLFGRAWVAAAAGLLFGLHPTSVESVAWIAQRKATLSAFFSLLSLVLYVVYARRPSVWRYAGCLVMLLLALLSKPTSTPLPLLMLLLDYWPLNRLGKRAVVEKLPLLALSAVFAVITVISQARTASVTAPGGPSGGQALLVLCHNVVFYLWHFCWPRTLTPYYPYPQPLTIAQPMVLAGVVGTAVLVALLIVSWRYTRAFVVGGLFFFVAIFPALGVVGFANTIAADRFLYLPMVGLLLPVAWLLTRVLDAARAGSRAALATTAAVVVLAALVVLDAWGTRQYLSLWRDTETLHRHMIAVVPDALEPRCSLGSFFEEEGRGEDAIALYREVLAREPRYLKALNNLGNSLTERGRAAEAVPYLQRAIELKPDFVQAHVNLASSLAQLGRVEEAWRHFNQAQQIKPLGAGTYNAFGVALAQGGRPEDAVRCFTEALRLVPDSADVHANWGNTLAMQGRLAEAIEHYEQSLKLDPAASETHSNLGNVLFQLGRLDESLAQHAQAVKLDPRNADSHYNYGVVLERAGRTEEALAQYREALRLNPGDARAQASIRAMEGRQP